MYALFLSPGVCSAVVLTIKPDQKTFLVGNNFHLRCKCYMNPTGTYAFTKDGSAVTTDNRITLERNKLHVKNATKSDSGSYSCAATSSDSVQIDSTETLSISVVGMYMILLSISLDLPYLLVYKSNLCVSRLPFLKAFKCGLKFVIEFPKKII